MQTVTSGTGGNITYPWGEAIDQSNDILYVADFGTSIIQEFNLNGGTITNGNGPITGSQPWGMDFYNNYVYVAVYGAWLMIDPATNNVAVSMPVTGQAVGLSVDKSNGDVYVTDSNGVSVFQYNGGVTNYAPVTTNLPVGANLNLPLRVDSL